MGRSFKLFTDHRSFKHLLYQRITTTYQQYWLSKLLEYYFDVLYKLGRENKVAKYTSLRRYCTIELRTTCMNPCWLDFSKLKEEIQT